MTELISLFPREKRTASSSWPQLRESVLMSISADLFSNRKVICLTGCRLLKSIAKWFLLLPDPQKRDISSNKKRLHLFWDGHGFFLLQDQTGHPKKHQKMSCTRYLKKCYYLVSSLLLTVKFWSIFKHRLNTKKSRKHKDFRDFVFFEIVSQIISYWTVVHDEQL